MHARLPTYFISHGGGPWPYMTGKFRHTFDVLDKIEARDALDVAQRTCQRCEAIFDYAIHRGVCESNPASGRAKYLKKRKTVHRPHLMADQLPEFLMKLDAYHGRDYIKIAMQFLVLTFVRPGELRNARWDEIDIENAVWKIPADKMKMNRDHVVPLNIVKPEAIAIVKSCISPHN